MHMYMHTLYVVCMYIPSTCIYPKQTHVGMLYACTLNMQITYVHTYSLILCLLIYIYMCASVHNYT